MMPQQMPFELLIPLVQSSTTANDKAPFRPEPAAFNPTLFMALNDTTVPIPDNASWHYLEYPLLCVDA